MHAPVFPSCQVARNVNPSIYLTDCWVGTGLSVRVGLIACNSATNLHFPVDLRWQEGDGEAPWLAWRLAGGDGRGAIGTLSLIHLRASPAVKSKHSEQDAHTARSSHTLGQTHLTEITRRLRGCRDRAATRRGMTCK